MRPLVLAAPALLLTYGVLRFFGSLDGTTRGGWTWTVGHLAYFVSIALFAAVAVRLAVESREQQGMVALSAAAAVVVGAACSLWVIAGDLNADVAELPDALLIAGPALFSLGSLVLLILRAYAGHLPVWSPALFLAGFAAITINLDLLPVGALLILLAFRPLAARPAP